MSSSLNPSPQSRLQASYYRHPLHFANDFRRMITETYRYSLVPEMSERAADLQHQFELRFARIDYEPVEDPSIYDDSSAVAEEESFLHQLAASMSQLSAIQGRGCSELSRVFAAVT